MTLHNPDPETHHDGALELGEDAFGNTVSLLYDEDLNCIWVYVNGETGTPLTPDQVRGLAVGTHDAARLQD